MKTEINEVIQSAIEFSKLVNFPLFVIEIELNGKKTQQVIEDESFLESYTFNALGGKCICEIFDGAIC